jgi:hypothetical protein
MAKTAAITVRLNIVKSVTVNGHCRIECYCGRSVEGEKEIVEAAHRQHMARHEAAA